MEFLKEAVPDRRHHMLQCMQRSGDVLCVALSPEMEGQTEKARGAGRERDRGGVRQRACASVRRRDTSSLTVPITFLLCVCYRCRCPLEFRYVPKGWGHAILNTRTSIGFAGEFRIVKALPSPSDIQGGYSWVRAPQILPSPVSSSYKPDESRSWSQVGKDAQRSLMLMSEGFSSRTKLHRNFLSLES